MKKELPILALIVLASGILSASLLTRGHLWWDDFASYIMQAQSILRGDMADFVRHNAISIQQSSFPVGPVAYPWGFPLILVPFYAVFGLNILGLKLINILFYGLFLTLFYFTARNRLSAAASAVLTGFFAFNPALLQAHDLLLSDIPFLFFTTLTIALFERFIWEKEAAPPAIIQICIGAALFMAVFIRTTGIALLAALFVLDFIRPRRVLGQIRAHAAIYITFFALYSLQSLVFPGGQESYFTHFDQFSFARLLENIAYYFTLPVTLFEPLPAAGLLYALTGILFVAGAITNFWRSLPALAFSAILLAINILWPERQGLRFIYPILPFFALLACLGGQALIERLPLNRQSLAQNGLIMLWVALSGIFLAISLTLGGLLTGVRPEINGPFDDVSRQMFTFIREQTPPNSLVIFFKPRAMRLFTDRDSIMLRECSRLGEGNYVVIHEKMADNDQVSPEQIENCNPSIRLQKVFNNKRFTVYKIGEP